MRRAFTLVEIVVFFLIAVIVLLLAMDLFSGSGRLLKQASRTAGGQVELQNFVETFATDIEDLAYFKEAPNLDLKGGGSGKFEFAVVSNRTESGLDAAPQPELRSITYEFAASRQPDCMTVSRTVAQLKPAGKLEDKVKTGASRQIADSIQSCKIVPFAWGPVKGTGWRLCAVTDPLAKEEGAGAACVSLSVAVSEPAGDKDKEGGDLALTTRLWCRGRLLSLTREGRPQ